MTVNAAYLADRALAISASQRLVVLIDGRSGAGKTTLAAALSEVLAGRMGRPIQVVHMDDCYPGWDGLAAGADAVAGMLTAELPGYRRYDWDTGSLAEWVPLDASAPTLIEGTGALTPASAALASFSIWLDRDQADRRRDALARDPYFAPMWDMWAAQEERHIAANHPVDLADALISL